MWFGVGGGATGSNASQPDENRGSHWGGGKEILNTYKEGNIYLMLLMWQSSH